MYYFLVELESSSIKDNKINFLKKFKIQEIYEELIILSSDEVMCFWN
jgi:hypothetical protein